MPSLDLICFPGAPNLPVFASLENAWFEEAGVAVRLETTPSSTSQMERLHAGEFQIAGTAFDNVVAYREGEGAIELDVPSDVVAFMGATQIELSFVVSSDVQSFADLVGRSIALDALTTGFAFVLYAMLEGAGVAIDDCELVPVGATPKRWESVKTGEHAGTLTIEPFTSIAVANGFRVLQASRDIVPSYQGGVFAASRAWAEANADQLTAFIRGYLSGLAWTLASKNYDQAKAILLRNMPAIQPAVADAVLRSLLDPSTGLSPGGRFVRAGLDAVLALRSRYARAGQEPLSALGRYVDSKWLESVGDD